jgi:hypothetical protein
VGGKESLEIPGGSMTRNILDFSRRSEGSEIPVLKKDEKKKLGTCSVQSS